MSGASSGRSFGTTSDDPAETSAEQRAGPPPGAVTVCLGHAMVDLICECPLDDVALADAFVPHFGGAVANVTVVAARHGAHVALAGAVGEDSWGRWLRDRLEREGVELSLFELVPGSSTPLAMVALSATGEPSYRMYGDAVCNVLPSLGDRLEDAVRAAAAIYFSSSTLVDSAERDATMRARELALELGRPVVFAPNLRRHGWRSRAEAAAAANACVRGALLVRASAREAALMTGEDDPERSALALLKAGARMVVITLGPEGAILRGELRVDVPGRPADAISTVGAADVLTGILLARLATSGFYPAAVAASLPEAVVKSSLGCERWGALE